MSRLSCAPLSTLAAEGAGPFLEQMLAEDLTEQLRDPFAVSRLLQSTAAGVHFIKAKFLQKFCKLSVPPKSVVKLVKSTSTMSPARC